MRHRLWVYSGRRGVHCWVCDDAVRRWSPALRAAAVEYLTLVKVGAQRRHQAAPPLPRPPALADRLPRSPQGGTETVKKVNLSEPIHPFIK